MQSEFIGDSSIFDILSEFLLCSNTLWLGCENSADQCYTRKGIIQQYGSRTRDEISRYRSRYPSYFSCMNRCIMSPWILSHETVDLSSTSKRKEWMVSYSQGVWEDYSELQMSSHAYDWWARGVWSRDLRFWYQEWNSRESMTRQDIISRELPWNMAPRRCRDLYRYMAMTPTLYWDRVTHSSCDSSYRTETLIFSRRCLLWRNRSTLWNIPLYPERRSHTVSTDYIWYTTSSLYPWKITRVSNMEYM